MSKAGIWEFVFVLFAIFILHSRESELYRYTLDGKSALAWELPFSRFCRKKYQGEDEGFLKVSVHLKEGSCW